MEGGRRRLFCFAMQSRRRRKKVGDGRCGRRARRSRSSVRPMPIEIADGAPASGNRGNTAMAAVPAPHGSRTELTRVSLVDAGSPDPRRHGPNPAFRGRCRTYGLFSHPRCADPARRYRKSTCMMSRRSLGQAGRSEFPGDALSADRFQALRSLSSPVSGRRRLRPASPGASPLRGAREMAAAPGRYASGLPSRLPRAAR